MKKIVRKGNTLVKLLASQQYKEVFKRINKNIDGKSSEFRVLVEVEELKPKVEEAIRYLKENQAENENFGDYFEFGVSHGTSFSMMYKILDEQQLQNVRLFGFDSFKGLPDDSEGLWYRGDFYAKYKNVRKHLRSQGIDLNRAKLIKGWFRDTLTNELIIKEQLKKASIIMIDCDIYSATKEALDFCKPLIKDQCIIIFDDWNSQDNSDVNGERKAFEEFLHENPFIKSKDFGKYSYFGYPNGEIKLITNTDVSRSK